MLFTLRPVWHQAIWFTPSYWLISKLRSKMLWFLTWHVRETSEEKETYLRKSVRLFINDAGRKNDYMLPKRRVMWHLPSLPGRMVVLSSTNYAQKPAILEHQPQHCYWLDWKWLECPYFHLLPPSASSSYPQTNENHIKETKVFHILY